MATTHSVKNLFRRLTSTDSEIEADDLIAASDESGARHASDCGMGEVAMLCGVIRAVTLHPSVKLPSLEAEMYDGSGVVRIVWLGRRRIIGIEPGQPLRVTGRITGSQGSPVMYNPRYDLLPSGAA